MSPPDDSDSTESISLSEQGFDEAPAKAVVTLVAEMTEQSPLEMEPLCEVIDHDALNLLFDRPNDQPPSMTVTFDYCGQQVTLTADAIQLSQSDSAGG